MATRPQDLSLEEFYILAQSYPAGSPEFDEVFDIAVRMFPKDEAANLNAANAAMAAGEFARAEKYLSRAGQSAEAYYARGIYGALTENWDESFANLEKAKNGGMTQAEEAIDSIKAAREAKSPVSWIKQ